jgi:hypothetical protein
MYKVSKTVIAGEGFEIDRYEGDLGGLDIPGISVCKQGEGEGDFGAIVAIEKIRGEWYARVWMSDQDNMLNLCFDKALAHPVTATVDDD